MVVIENKHCFERDNEFEAYHLFVSDKETQESKVISIIKWPDVCQVYSPTSLQWTNAFKALLLYEVWYFGRKHFCYLKMKIKLAEFILSFRIQFWGNASCDLMPYPCVVLILDSVQLWMKRFHSQIDKKHCMVFIKFLFKRILLWKQAVSLTGSSPDNIYSDFKLICCFYITIRVCVF